MAIAAYAASVSIIRSSSAVNSEVPILLVRYICPNNLSPSKMGTPKNDSMGGCLGGKPELRGSSCIFVKRIVRFSFPIAPISPNPTGGFPIALISSLVIPIGMNSISFPSSSTTPKAA